MFIRWCWVPRWMVSGEVSVIFAMGGSCTRRYYTTVISILRGGLADDVSFCVLASCFSSRGGGLFISMMRECNGGGHIRFGLISRTVFRNFGLRVGCVAYRACCQLLVTSLFPRLAHVLCLSTSLVISNSVTRL